MEDSGRSRLLGAQAALIGSMLIDGSIAGELIARVPPEDFTDPTMRGLFEGCRRLYLAGKPVDAVLLASELGEGSKATIVDCMDLTPTARSWQSYAEQLRRDAAIQRLRDLGLQLSGVTDPAEGEALLQEGLRLFDRRTGPRRTSLAEGLDSLLKRLEDPGARPRYFPLGFSALGGRVRLGPGKLVILGGYPSSGKTALALTMALSISRVAKVGFFSLETDETDIFQRMAAFFAGVKYAHVQDAEPTAEELGTLKELLPMFRSESFVVERASRLNVATLQTAALSQKYDVIFIDYVQLIDAPGRERWDIVTNISMGLHRMAQQLGVTVIGLSQITPPDKSSSRRVTKDDLRESRQLKQDADAILIMTPAEDGNKNLRELTVDKNKDGASGRLLLNFDPKHMTFTYATPPGKTPANKPPMFEDLDDKEGGPLPF